MMMFGQLCDLSGLVALVTGAGGGERGGSAQRSHESWHKLALRW
jgi:hypothetical protein